MENKNIDEELQSLSRSIGRSRTKKSQIDEVREQAKQAGKTTNIFQKLSLSS